MDQVLLERLIIGLISAVVSGIIAITIATKINRNNESRKLKTDLLRKLMGNRNDIHSKEFTESLNSIFVVFYQSKEVVSALKEFHQVVVSTKKTSQEVEAKLIELIRSICQDLGIDTAPLSDEFFIKPFQTKK
ncbi:DUF6680 family protein [Paenibacillus sp. SYP-B4298]|uniref:DUF6680 family protein n=1 Tax=Paenibacillus sp. SYP-B4298 TaxID=2996034 RepID=UPI0022DD8089|nr:DUF6680 family protein [Paenibacillus sp. SYP-B4298]